MKRAAIALVIVVGLLAVVVLYVLSSPGALDMFRSHALVTDQKATNKIVFGYVGNPYEDDYQNSRIPGYMINRSRDKIAAVNLEISLYNDKGDRKEIVKYTLNDVAPGEKKSFDANAGPLSGPRNAKVKIVSVEVVK